MEIDPKWRAAVVDKRAGLVGADYKRNSLRLVAKLIVAIVLASASAQIAPALEVTNRPQCLSCFVGELRLSPNPADGSGKTKLLAADLFFVGGDGTVWKAGAGDVTDG